MREIGIVVEGQTEEAFVSNVLAPHLWSFGVHPIVVVVTTSRAASGKKNKGGGSWRHYRQDVLKLLGGSNLVLVTTMVDFYAYPSDAPGADCCAGPHAPRQCVRRRAAALAQDIDNPRFIPYIVLHEFETLVFASVVDRQTLLGSTALAQKLQSHNATVGDDVELINDGPDTAPSKRIAVEEPLYDKVSDGVAAIEEASLAHAAAQMVGLRRWLDRLEVIGSAPS